MQIESISLEQNHVIINMLSNKESRFNFFLKNEKTNKIHLIDKGHQNNNESRRISIQKLKKMDFGTYELGLSKYNYKPISYEGELQINQLLSKNELISIEIISTENKTILIDIKPNISFNFKRYNSHNDAECKGLIELENRSLFNLNVKSSIIFKYRTKSNSYNSYNKEVDQKIDLNKCISFNITELFDDNPKTEIIDLFIKLETQSYIHEYPLHFYSKKDMDFKYYCSNSLFVKFKPFATIHNTLAFIKRRVDIEVLLSEVNELEDSLKISGVLISEDILISKIKRINLVLKSGYRIEKILNANINNGIFNFDIYSSFINNFDLIQKWELYIRIYNNFDKKIDIPMKLFNFIKNKFKISNHNLLIYEAENSRTLIDIF
ncbi:MULTISPECIES: hypothetical protein [Bacillus amyloliquefaciens group]|uniref:hypothetical protein n=1 Tax=Bacillus amyloliquefaciens group TaxID=1938374 RepID=UPI001048DE60|nr:MULTISPECIES: hypothetical protein [Bacillus amyloliquefaciens group]QOH67856.1 hypothetical protein DKG78_17580 [Bacillus amyloliquefaciens]